MKDQAITAIIKQLKSLNKIVIISSHILSILQDIVDEIYLLEGGKVTMHEPDSPTLIAELEKTAVDDKMRRLGFDI